MLEPLGQPATVLPPLTMPLQRDKIISGVEPIRKTVRPALFAESGAARAESQGSMIESFKARMPQSLPTVSSALRGGMLASALLAIVLVVAFRAAAPSATATQRQINRPATAFTLPAEQ